VPGGLRPAPGPSPARRDRGGHGVAEGVVVVAHQNWK
jgi:hypothetical protein